MLFDRHRKLKRQDDPPAPKKSSLADAFFRRLPIAFTRRARSKTSLLSTIDTPGLTSLPRQSTSLPNVTLEACSSVSSPRLLGADLPSSLPTTSNTTAAPNRQNSFRRQRCVTSTAAHPIFRRHSLVFDDLRIQKRHSIEPRLYRLSKLINDENDTRSSNKQRHSYTFGKHEEMKALSLKDLVLDPLQERKLDLFLEQRRLRSSPLTPNNIGSMTSALATPTIIVPQRSVSHQLLSPPKHPLVRAHSTSSSSIHQQEDMTQYCHSPLDAATLVGMLDQQSKGQMNSIMLIDVRNLVEYQKQRICGSLNVNLPSLLIKRYQRGAVSNFHLENFITTAEGREQYLSQRSSSTASTNTTTSTPSSTSTSPELAASTLSSSPSSLSPLSTVPRLSPGSSTSSSSDTNCSLAEKDSIQPNSNISNGTIWVVYDDDMNDQHKASQAWTLLNVLCKATSDTNDKIYYLHGGFYGFVDNTNCDSQRWIEGIGNDSSMDFIQGSDDNNGDSDMDLLQQRHSNGRNRLTLSTSTSSGTSSAHQKRLNKVSPRRSLSCTIGDGSKGQQQTSLFSLDTQAARENNANALARRASRRSQQLQQQHLSIGTNDSKKRLSLTTTVTASLRQKTTSKHNSSIRHHQNKRNGNKSINTPSPSIPPSSSSSLSIPSSTTQKQAQSPTPSSLSTTATTPLSPPSSTNSLTTGTTPPLLARVMEEDYDDDVAYDDDDDVLGQMTADISPRTETDFDFTISEIIPGFLYVGPEIETNDQANQLLARPIRRVLNMAEECHDQPLLQHHHDLVYRKIAARDTVEMRNIDHVMMEAVGFIEEAKRYHEPIYVHCKAGKSRSVTAILAYLVSCERWTLKQSYRHVIKARPNMSPNIGFIAELMKLENQVHGRVSSFMETDWHAASLSSPGFSQELEQLQLAWEHSPATPTRPPFPLS
ncbi:hypothetical protein BCR42DRAFT_486661 [Absidia repens]|uniref:protein-tyrosine-phosphatase n=1 Tax=Absidia repens TaxID=90262 RepID=A0A1X2IYK3_9FUNG|nr:hypothetical protein BCR42DRAFT_486661 [Absidia repens]